MNGAPWPAEREAELRRLKAQGLSASEIGRRLGVSRSAVLGRLFRLGLCAPTKPDAVRRGAPRPLPTGRPPAPTSPALVRLAAFDPLARALVEGRRHALNSGAPQ